MAEESAARAEASHQAFMELFSNDPFSRSTLQQTVTDDPYLIVGEPPEADSANPLETVADTISECSPATPSPERQREMVVGPERVRPSCNPNKRMRIAEEELVCLRAERDAAAMHGIKWRQRGPPGPRGPQEPGCAAHTWRGQKWREGSRRWANNGGTNKDWYKHYYGIRKQNDAWAMQRFLEENHEWFRQSDTAKGPKELREFLASRASSARAL